MVRIGEITETRGGMIRITFCRQEACEKCRACDGEKKRMDVWISGEGNVGDIATVDLPESEVVRASAIAYGLPLVLFISGLILGGLFFSDGETGTVVGGICGLVVSAVIVAVTEKKRKSKGNLNPKLISVSEVDNNGNHFNI